MNHRIAAGILAALLLTGCSSHSGGTEQSEAQTAEITVLTETTAAETEETTAETEAQTEAQTQTTSAPAESADDEEAMIAAARAVLETYLEGQRDGDIKKVLSTSNMSAVLALMYGEPVTEEQLQETMGSTDAFARKDMTWTISGGDLNSVSIDELNQSLAEAKAEAESQFSSEETKAALEAVQQLYTPVDAVCLFTLEISEGSKEPSSEEIYLTRSNGKWTLDTTIISSMYRYVKKAKLTSANADAKSFYMAASAALIELEEENEAFSIMKMELLDGTIVFAGSDFENLKKPEYPTFAGDVDAETMKTLLTWKISRYFTEAVKLDSCALKIEGSVVKAAAVGKHYEQGTQYGAYPNQLTQDDSTVDSIEAALITSMKKSNDNG